MKLFRTNKSKWILTLVAFLLVAVVLISFGVKLSQQEKQKQANLLDYSIGTISSTTGKYVESNKSLYTKNLLKVEDMEIKVVEDATITYKVAFYDEDKDFVSMSDAQDDDFSSADIPEGAVYFRVVITPNQVDEEDVKITVLNLAKYSNMLKITYSK